jgi:hypothetical protein
LLKVHDWRDAFELARDEGVLTWEYESREQFLQLQDDISAVGWLVDTVEETRRPGGSRLSLGGLFSRPKVVLVTLRLKGRIVPEEAAQEDHSPPDLWRPREAEAAQNGNGNGHSNGHAHAPENGNGRAKADSTPPAEDDDQFGLYPEVDDSAVYSAD